MPEMTGILRIAASLKQVVEAGQLYLTGTASHSGVVSHNAMTSLVKAVYAAETLPAGSWR